MALTTTESKPASVKRPISAKTWSVERESRLRFCFVQDIFREANGAHVLHGRLIGTSLNRNGQRGFPPEIEELLASR